MASRIMQIKVLAALIGVVPAMAVPLASQCAATPRMALLAGGFAVAEITVLATRHDDWWTTPTRSFYLTSGGSASAGQDRLLHGAIAYHLSDLSQHAWRWACAGSAAPWLGAATGFLFELPKEIGDGLHEDKGFAVDDMAFAAVGAILPALHATVPTTRLATLKVNWWPSDELRTRVPGALPQVETDYAGQRYFLSLVPGRAWPALPVPWLGLAVGHSTATWAQAPPAAEWYLTVDIEPARLGIPGVVGAVIGWLGARIKVPLPGLRFVAGTVTAGLY